MNRIHRLPSAAGLTLWLASASLISACGGGSGGGQAPDPVVLDLPLAYISRPLTLEIDGEAETFQPPAILTPARFNPGARLLLKERATATANAVNISDRAFGDDALYDIRDLSAHPNGDRLLFSMRAPEIPNANDEDQPRWNIWEYDLRNGELRRVISSDIVAEMGHDLSPAYLPSGRIVFSSTRQTRSRAVLLDDNKPQYSALEESRNDPAFTLHVMDDDGTRIQQITYNQSHDLQPSVLADGRILFTRWDRFGNRNNLSLYTVNQDGTDLQFHYGYHSLNGQNLPTLFRPRQLPDGRILALMKPRASLYGGVMVAVDAGNYTENQVPTALNAGATGPALEPLLSLPVNIDGEPSPHGLYGSVHPLTDGTPRLLVSWSQCRLQEPDTGRIVPCTASWLATPGIQQAPPLFGIWIYHMDSETQQPVVVPEEEVMYTEMVSLEPRDMPCAYPASGCPARERDSALMAAGLGVLHIRSVYDRDGEDTTANGIADLADPVQTPANARPARFLRLIKAVSIPDRNTLQFDNNAFGVSTQQGMREILGYVPIEPDGSVMARVPADVAFTFDVVNGEGKRVNAAFPRHQNWLQLRAGERLDCQGCHTATSTVPHGRPDAEPFPAYPGAQGSFANTRRLDAFGTPELPDLGETMAEFDARVSLTCTDPGDPLTCTPRGPRIPSVNILFDDDWTDPDAATPTDSIAWRYADLTGDDYQWQPGEDPADPPAPTEYQAAVPTSEGCEAAWTGLCRVIINYEHHIQPLWERPRYPTVANEGVIEFVLDDDSEPVNHTCTGCHSRLDAEGQPRVPAASLALVTEPRFQTRMHAYQQLLRDRNELELVDGSLIERQEETGEFVCAEDPELALDDENCTPVPVLTTVPQAASMTEAGASNSQRFFNLFAASGSHAGYLNPSELKLLAEWLDLGAQYFNNPFDSVEQD
jgi:hypothetical protein